MLSKIYNLFENIKSNINKFINKVLLNHFKVEYGDELKVNGLITFVGHGKIKIGNNVTINSGKNINRIGGDIRTLLVALNNGSITIGNNVGISNSSLISHGSGILIEDDVMIGGSCKIYDTDFHSIAYEDRMCIPDMNIKMKKIHICKGVFIGAHTIILKGVTIGERSVVGAGSVVTKSIPADEVWAGNPARFIKKL